MTDHVLRIRFSGPNGICDCAAFEDGPYPQARFWIPFLMFVAVTIAGEFVGLQAQIIFNGSYRRA
jgi:hypothetical protein